MSYFSKYVKVDEKKFNGLSFLPNQIVKYLLKVDLKQKKLIKLIIALIRGPNQESETTIIITILAQSFLLS